MSSLGGYGDITINKVAHHVELSSQENLIDVQKLVANENQAIREQPKILGEEARKTISPLAHEKGPHMAESPTQAEIDAKLATIEARTETLFVKLDAKIDRLADAITGERGVVQQMKEIKTDNKSTRWTIAITVIGSVLAAIAALWTTQGNLLAAVQANFAAHPAAGSSVSQTHS